MYRTVLEFFYFMLKKIFTTFLGLLLGLALIAVGAVAIAVNYAYPRLPNLDAVTNYKPKAPLMIYSADNKLLGVYGEERRSFTKIDQFPKVLKDAVIAAEDKRFYDHWGVDLMGVVRAAVGNMISGQVESGASTITQQVAKNFFLTNERSFKRKFNEALLAYKIEKTLSKDQILELYFNQIYLGQRSYGFAAASMAYFNKPVQNLDLAEASMLAGLPKAPSAFNPLVNPERAKLRQAYILNNMLQLGMITQEQHDAALKEQLIYQSGREVVDENSLYVAEMARQAMYDKYGDAAYTQGFKVVTTVSSGNQAVATAALRQTLRTYSMGGYRGAEAYVDLSKFKGDNQAEQIQQYLSGFHVVENLVPAVVLEVGKQQLTVMSPAGKRIVLQGKNYTYVSKAINNPKLRDAQVRPGAVIRIVQSKNGQWSISQEPDLQGAIVSIDAQTGAIRALVGGYDFYQRAFNRATQAWRQPGSSFKPFLYSAALDKGFTAATLVNDAPISLPGLGPNGSVWNPKNADGRYAGMLTVHQALVASKNMVSIRLLMSMGVDYALQYLERFGIQSKDQPASLSLALGSGSVTPLQMAEGYAVFANGGYKVSGFVVDKIYNDAGELIAETAPQVAGKNAPLVIDPRNAFIMYKMMQDITRVGTAARARSLGRADIAGKTGTTNDAYDAWFVGYNPKVVTAVWVGYDTPRSMGRAAYGGVVALPVWIDYMRYALKGTPEVQVKMPARVVQRGNEYFYAEYQQTNPNLVLDNQSSGPIPPGEQDINNPDLIKSDNNPGMSQDTGTPLIPEGGGHELQPINTPPAPSGNGGGAGSKNGGNLDSLF